MRNETLIAQQIRARLISENARDLSDDTLARCLGPTIGKTKLVKIAAEMRDKGELFAPGYQGQHLHNLTNLDQCFLCGCVYYNCLCSHGEPVSRSL